MCIVLVLGFVGPRAALVFAWLFTSLIDRAFDGILFPLLGFVFLPWTTISYVLAWSPDGFTPLRWFIVGVGLAVDLLSHGSTWRFGPRRQVAYS